MIESKVLVEVLQTILIVLSKICAVVKDRTFC